MGRSGKTPKGFWLTLPKSPRPSDQRIGSARLHVGYGDLGDEEKQAIRHIEDGGQSGLEGGKLTQIDAELIVCIAAEEHMRTGVSVVDTREMLRQLGRVEHNLAFIPDQVGKIDIDENGTRSGAVLGIASPTLPGNDIARTGCR